MVSAGASRMSSVLDLKATPSTRMFLPLTNPSSRSSTLSTIRRRTVVVDRDHRLSDAHRHPVLLPIRASAEVSLGKQEPP